ncbi:hypothetical protein MMC10_005890 [Thelotrema lepadinum]|nr:hypothetical protein [Thelotrema lepadinum]
MRTISPASTPETTWEKQGPLVKLREQEANSAPIDRLVPDNASTPRRYESDQDGEGNIVDGYGNHIKQHGPRNIVRGHNNYVTQFYFPGHNQSYNSSTKTADVKVEEPHEMKDASLQTSWAHHRRGAEDLAIHKRAEPVDYESADDYKASVPSIPIDTVKTNADLLARGTVLSTSLSCTRLTVSKGFEKVDKPGKFFSRGRVFKAAWIEIAGPTTKDVENTTTVRYCQTAYTDIRRFVVLRKKEDCCICVPIHTFSGRGGGKRSTNRQDYALVFDAGRDETWDRERLSRKEIPMVVERDDVDISYPQARIQFSKLYTVEFYTMVQQLGYVHKEALEVLEQAFLDSIPLELNRMPLKEGLQSGKTLKSSLYRPHPENEFKLGRIFKIVWFEPNGAHPDGSLPYIAVRRFLIIREPRGEKAGCCHCLPISSNGGKGALHYGSRAKDCAIIFTDTAKNKVLAGENITKKPIRMLPDTLEEGLAPTTRLDYGKIYTVECNFGVSFIGNVDPEDLPTVVSDFNSVMVHNAEYSYIESSRKSR